MRYKIIYGTKDVGDGESPQRRNVDVEKENMEMVGETVEEIGEVS